MIQHRVRLVENVRLAERTYRMRLADAAIAERIRPGQFVMLRVVDRSDPLLGRPFALYDTYLDAHGAPAGYDIVYLVVGKITGLMSGMGAGDEIEVWGPLGNGFSLAPSLHVMMVAGGIGQTPFPAVARAYLGVRGYGVGHGAAGACANAATEHAGGAAAQAATERIERRAETITLCYGARSECYLAGLDDFRAIGMHIAISTDDGSAGHHGFVTDLVRRSLDSAAPPTRLLGCGPEPMMHALAELAAAASVPCELSLETPMACGIGACFSCVAKIRQGPDAWDYRRVCVDGPVFDAAQVVF